jgi:hypothetical protein
MNEFCEGEADLMSLSLFTLRETAAFTLMITMPLEGLIRKGKWVRLTILKLGIVGFPMLVKSVSRAFLQFTQSLGLKWYPPEIE